MTTRKEKVLTRDVYPPLSYFCTSQWRSVTFSALARSSLVFLTEVCMVFSRKLHTFMYLRLALTRSKKTALLFKSMKPWMGCLHLFKPQINSSVLVLHPLLHSNYKNLRLRERCASRSCLEMEESCQGVNFLAEGHHVRTVKNEEFWAH